MTKDESLDALTTLLRAKTPIIVLQHNDEPRCLDIIRDASLNMAKQKSAQQSDAPVISAVATWNVFSGVSVTHKDIAVARTPLESEAVKRAETVLRATLKNISSDEPQRVIAVLQQYVNSQIILSNPDERLPAYLVMVIQDAHNLLGDDKFRRAIREFYYLMRPVPPKMHVAYTTVVLLTNKNVADIPELVEVSSFIYVKPPRRDEIINSLAPRFPNSSRQDIANIASALAGLEDGKVQHALRVSQVSLGKPDIPLLTKQKIQSINGTTGLSYTDTSNMSLDDIGGLAGLKEWLTTRAEAFTEKAQAYGLDTPKGVLLLGPPGTGKSFTAKAISSYFKMPMLSLDMGSLFGSLLGESEANLTRALAQAESIAPCVLLIDEIEKGLKGGDSDGGTGNRMLGKILSWMQDRTYPVFVVATANSVRRLPPELLRKGRFDEIFYVDFPTDNERADILRIHTSKRSLTIDPACTDELVKMTVNYTGAELNSLVTEAMYHLFHNRSTDDNPDRTLTMSNFESALKHTKPVYALMREAIDLERSYALGRARVAGSEIIDIPSVNTGSVSLEQIRDMGSHDDYGL